MRIRPTALVVALALTAATMALGQGRTFEGQDFSDSRFTGCDLQMTQFTNCRLLGAQFINISQSPKLLFKSSYLDDPVFEDLKLTDSRWRRVAIDGLDAYDMDAEDWEIEQSNLTDLTFVRSYLRYVVLDHSEMRDFRSQWSNIPRGRWQSTNLRDSDFHGCDFSDSSFYSGSMEDAEFRNVDFSDVRLENCDVRGLVINGVRIDELID